MGENDENVDAGMEALKRTMQYPLIKVHNQPRRASPHRGTCCAATPAHTQKVLSARSRTP